MKLKTIFFIALFSLTLSNFLFSSENYKDNWPNWRGPNTTGEALNSAPPVEWSETKNIKWKTPVPGNGLSSPVIWGDQIFITTAIELDQKATEEAIKRQKKKSHVFLRMLKMSKRTKNFLQFVVYSINRKTGEINWKKVVRKQYPHEGVQKNGSWAAASCVTDGEHIIASFGSYGIYCFDMSGNPVWEKDLGDMQIYGTFGEGASPVIYKDNLIIVWDHEGQSKIYLLNKSNGEEIWQKDRDEPSSWATPVIAELENKVQIIVNGKKMSTGYNIANGEVIWENTGLDGDVVVSPVFDGEMAYLMTGGISGNKIIQAINLKTAKGQQLENSDAVVWTSDKKPPYIPSPLLKKGKLYYLEGNKCRLSCVEAKTGKIYYLAQKMEGMKSVYASPVYANGYIYVVDRKGNCSVIKEGTEFEVVFKNKLEDKFDASPAIVGNELFLRGLQYLYCISEK